MLKVGRTHPGLVALPVTQRAARIVELTGLAEDGVLLALAGQPAAAPQFTALIRTLQAIETALTRRPAEGRGET
jgi:hypothetical protein